MLSFIAPQVVLPPDPELLDHLVAHGVHVDTGVTEEDRLRSTLMIQVGM